GYLAVGYYSRLNQQVSDETASGSGCFDPGPLPTGTECWNLTMPGYQLGYNRQALAFFDLSGKLIWEKAFITYDLRRAIQTSDGGFIAVGSTWSTRYGNAIPIKYNPETGDTTKYFSTASPYSN